MIEFPQAYIGDGVYAEFDGYHIILTVPAGSHATGLEQRIALEPPVLKRLESYRAEIAAICQELRAKQEAEQADE